MSPFQGLVCLVGVFFFWDVVYWLIGSLLAKTRRFHKVGIRMLAMSLLVPGRSVARQCRQDCDNVRCGNWTCTKYSKPNN